MEVNKIARYSRTRRLGLNHFKFELDYTNNSKHIEVFNEPVSVDSGAGEIIYKGILIVAIEPCVVL